MESETDERKRKTVFVGVFANLLMSEKNLNMLWLDVFRTILQ